MYAPDHKIRLIVFAHYLYLKKVGFANTNLDAIQVIGSQIINSIVNGLFWA